MTNTVRACVIALILVAFTPGLGRIGYASTMVPGDSLSMGFCKLSDNGSFGLCAHELVAGSGFYGVSWSGAVCRIGLHYFWDSAVDATCSRGYGLHTNQSASAGSDGFVQMQIDGNFVLYSQPATAQWATNTEGYGSSAFLNLQNDGNLVVYYNTNVPIWSIF